MSYYKTSEIARAVGVHPNTVRLYETWGLLPAVSRNENGYRFFTERHLDQMRLARIALRCGFAVGNIRRLAMAVVKTAAGGDLTEALDGARTYLARIQSERARAEEALLLARRWVGGKLDEPSAVYSNRLDVARLLNVSIDVLRNWERNGLIHIPRNPHNRYRVYGSREIGRLKVIRTLRAANYSIMSILRMMRHIDAGGGEESADLLNTPQPQEDIIGATDRWIATLAATEEDARELIAHLEMMARKKY